MIHERNKKIRAALVVCALSLGLLAVLFSVVPASADKRKNKNKQRAPGLYSLTGWNGQSWGQDINGEVGHPMFVNGPTADCQPSGNWTANSRILSGTLPPGVTLNHAPSTITGLPTERGHWIVKMELYDVQCGGQGYEGLTQELRFHISGSGKVVQ